MNLRKIVIAVLILQAFIPIDASAQLESRDVLDAALLRYQSAASGWPV